MLFTWDPANLCIVFRWWHVTSTWTLILSLIGVVLLTAGYEGVREMSRRYEASSAEYLNSLPSKGLLSSSDADERAKFSLRRCTRIELIAVVREKRGQEGAKCKISQGGIVCNPGLLQFLHYVCGARHMIAISTRSLTMFHHRLLFMTYNGWVMLAVAVGAFVGYLGFGGSASKSVACH